jgi:NAD-dependent deacetylase
MKNKIFIFTGSGISVESGIPTFRTGSDGLWYNHKIEEVATIDAWSKDRQKVLNFYNLRRAQLSQVEPNLGHKIIADLQQDFELVLATQNVDNLHERAGSQSVIHLHGELTKSQSSLDPDLIYDCPGDINIGDNCEKGSQLRPNITWFGENLDWKKIHQCEKAAGESEVCIIVGTSMQVSPANLLPFKTPESCIIYYVDPGPVDFYIPKSRLPFFYHIKETSTIGLQKVKEELYQIFNK